MGEGGRGVIQGVIPDTRKTTKTLTRLADVKVKVKISRYRPEQALGFR
jgi:hypothetical protein